ncbi:MAG TPA: rhomboid family intramembrane serine protease [Longimicrobium sp.]|nr:rhomboid family intramembrane serine protease [Longimicrobium sp.]
MSTEKRSITRELKLHAVLLATLLAAMWGLEVADALVFAGGLDAYGIRPRDPDGLWGIAFAPFLHGGFEHLAGNSVPFLALGWLILLHEVRDFVVASLAALVVGGLGTWAVGAPGVHIGASGIVFGYLGYLLMRGWYRRSLGAVLLSVGVFILYGGLLWGVLPGTVGISWEGHLFGFLGGALAARLLVRRAAPEPRLRVSV